MAAVDVNGNWEYTAYSTDSLQIVGFGQTLLLRDILRQHPNLWPMRSCFGGVALYDMATWATPECDYDLDAIHLLDGPSATDDGQRTTADPASIFPSLSDKTDSAPHEVAGSLNRQLDQLQQPADRWTLDPKYTLSEESNGDTCEHLTFQQCLYDANRRADNGGPKRVLNIGIQPELVIQRQAAILNRWEDIFHMIAAAGRIVLVATGMALMIVPFLRCLLVMNVDSKTRIRNKDA
jgi:hypothetical protein